MNQNLKIARELLSLAKLIISDEHGLAVLDRPVQTVDKKQETSETTYEIDKVIIRVVPWGTRLATGTINVVQGGQKHYKFERVKNLLDRNTPNFEYSGKSPEETAKLKQDVIDCFGSEQNLIEKLKDLEQTGVFYAQVDNFRPYCDSYHIKNEQNIEIYVKFFIDKKQRQKADFVFLVSCHTDRKENASAAGNNG